MPASYVYSSCNPITVGCYLFTDACLGTPAASGKYSDSVNCFTVTSGGYVSSSESSSFYYHYSVDVYECGGGVCFSSSYIPANGLIAYGSTLTVGTYILDSTSGYIFYTTGYNGYGSYGGQIITYGGENSTCDTLCSIE